MGGVVLHGAVQQHSGSGDAVWAEGAQDMLLLKAGCVSMGVHLAVV